MIRPFIFGGLAASVLGLAACGGSSDSPSSGATSLKFTGSVGQGFVAATEPAWHETLMAALFGKTAIANLTGEVNEIWAVPLYRMNGQTWANWNMVRSSPLEDGAFDIGVDGDHNWVLLLMNTNAAHRKDHVVAYVTLTEDVLDGASMVVMPTETVNDDVEEIELGELEQGTDEGRDDEAQSNSLNEETAEHYRLELDQLRELASVDDTFKAIKNDYVNRLEGNQYYSMRVLFSWIAPEEDGKRLAGNGVNGEALTHPSNITLSAGAAGSAYIGYSPRAETNRLLPAAEAGFCEPEAENRTRLAIVPPVDDEADAIEHSLHDIAYWRERPIGNIGDLVAPGGNDCATADFAIRQTERDGEIATDFTLWGDSTLKGEVPSGVWTVELGEEEVAWFDVRKSYPFDAQGNPSIYLPAPQLDLSDTGEVLAIDIEWYRWSSQDSAYVKANLETLAMVGYDFGVGLVNHDIDGVQARGSINQEQPPTRIVISELAYSDDATLPEGEQWHYGNNASVDAFHVTELGISYRTPSGDYTFRWY